MLTWKEKKNLGIYYCDGSKIEGQEVIEATPYPQPCLLFCKRISILLSDWVITQSRAMWDPRSSKRSIGWRPAKVKLIKSSPGRSRWEEGGVIMVVGGPAAICMVTLTSSWVPTCTFIAPLPDMTCWSMFPLTLLTSLYYSQMYVIDMVSVTFQFHYTFLASRAFCISLL